MRTPGLRPTLAEIARMAGVHTSTVSRALTHSHEVSSETVNRIRLIADELGYQPNPAALSLRTGQSRTIGVLVPRLTDYVLARIFEGIDDIARAHGYSTVVSTSNDSPDIRLDRLHAMLAQRPRGMIVGDARIADDTVVDTLTAAEVPFVLVNRPHPGGPSVSTDDREGGRIAARHLLELGHTRAGVIAGPAYAATCAERTAGFVEEFRDRGFSLDPAAIVESAPDTAGGYTACAAILDRSPDVTAVFAINDFAAIGAMGAARGHGRTVGRDLSLVGFNDIPLAAQLPVPLTTVASDMHGIGTHGAETLLQVFAGERPAATLIEPVLQARATTGPPSR